jgi:zinc/manganese transport system substrate-binding protein
MAHTLSKDMTMKKFLITISASLLALLCFPAHAKLNVLACEPEWAALAIEIGGDKVVTTSATTAMQDPHRIEPRPSLIARARNADLLICTGLELEAGWLPILLQQSANPKIALGQKGNFEAGNYVQRLDIPASVNRSDGDVHASGNPHIQQNPHNIAAVADALVKRLADIDPSNAAYYQTRHKDFASRWNAAITKWEQMAAPLKGTAVIEHHKNMEYLTNWLGLKTVGTLEQKPGVEPSAAHLSELLNQLKQQPAKLIILAAYQDTRPSHWLAERAKIPALVLPFTVGGNDSAKNLFLLFEDTLRRLLMVQK